MTVDRKERRRYRKVSTRVWGDDKFQALSAPQPNAQTLWFYLMAGPHTGVIPGLSVTGEAALAEGLSWPLASFRRCFAEITDQAMAIADWKSRVLWIPKSVFFNEPENPNVVVGWAKAFDDIPDCDLKGIAFDALRGFLKALPEGKAEGKQQGLLKAFDEALRRHHVKTCSKGFDIQKQKQEQKQEQEGVLLADDVQELANRAARFIERYEQFYQQHRRGARYLVKPSRDFMYAEQLCRTWPDERLDQIAAFFLTTDHVFAKNGSRTIGQLTALASWCDDQIAQKGVGSAPRGCRHQPPCVDDAAHTTRMMAEKRQVPE